MKVNVLITFFLMLLLSCKKEEPQPPIEQPVENVYSMEEIHSNLQGIWVNDSSITYYNGVGGNYGYYPENPNDTVEVNDYTWHKYGGFTSQITISENNIYFQSSGATWHIDTLSNNFMILSMINGFTYVNYYERL
jgi:hypothetical protein